MRCLLLVQVVFIIFLHALVPHAHHGEMSDERHQSTHREASGFLDHVGLIFQEGSPVSLKHFIFSDDGSTDREEVYHNPLPALAGLVPPHPAERRHVVSARPGPDTSPGNVFFFAGGWRGPPV